MAETNETTKRFTWTVQIEVDETWVADGFDLTDERLHEMIAHDLNFAYGHEFGGKVLTAPEPDEIAKAQGYSSDHERKWRDLNGYTKKYPGADAPLAKVRR